MNETIVLSGSRQETQEFARQRELRRVRYITGAQMLRGLRSAEVHVLPGFHFRPDRHAINAELRYRRGVTTIHYAKVEGGLFVTAGEQAAQGRARDSLGVGSAAELIEQIQGTQLSALEAATVEPMPQPKSSIPAKPRSKAPQKTTPPKKPAPKGDLFDFLDGKS